MAGSPYARADDAPGGGAKIYRSLSVLVAGQQVKSTGGGRLYGWHLSNSGAAAVFVKLYNQTAAAASTDTPVMTVRLAAGGVSTLDLSPGIGFALGISVRASTGVADNDNTAPGANEVVINLFYA